MLLDWLMVVFLVAILYVVVVSVIFLAVYAAMVLLRFILQQVIPAPFRFGKWLLGRYRTDHRIAEIQSIGGQARQDMEALTNEYLRLVSRR